MKPKPVSTETTQRLEGKVDWPELEMEFKAGRVSVREMARRRGISDTAIRLHMREAGITRTEPTTHPPFPSPIPTAPPVPILALALALPGPILPPRFPSLDERARRRRSQIHSHPEK